MDWHRPHVWAPPREEVGSREFYATSLERVVGLLRDVEGVESIYTFGSIKAPGNSDIDLMIVIERDRGAARRVLDVFETELTPLEQFVMFQHDPMIVDRRVGVEIEHVRPASDLRLLHGPPLEFKATFDAVGRLYILLELLTQYYPRVFLAAQKPVRLRFQHINAFGFTYALFCELGASYGFGGLAKRRVFDARECLAKNDEMRAAYGRRDIFEEDVGNFLSRAEHYLAKLSTEMIADVATYLDGEFETGDEVRSFVVRRDRLFASDYNGGARIVVPFMGKQLRFWQYPHVYHRFFGGRLPERYQNAVRLRNSALRRYCTFMDRYAYGRGLYRPWWLKKDKLKNRMSRVIGGALASRHGIPSETWLSPETDEPGGFPCAKRTRGARL